MATCADCGGEITTPGAIIVEPPDENGNRNEIEICHEDYEALRGEFRTAGGEKKHVKEHTPRIDRLPGIGETRR